MNHAAKGLALVAVAAAFASAQNNNIPQIQHVIVVIQENRTPTNLFHEDAKLVAKGAHVIPPNNQGACGPILKNPVKSCTDANENTAITLTGLPLVTPVSLDHLHYPTWQCTFDNGAMDGACHIKVFKNSNSSDISGCPGGGYQQYCPYTFVNNDAGILDPYFNIAEQYGFANWMFQTNQGASQVAHLFLFSGTSAPVYKDGDSQEYWKWFVAENAGGTYGPKLTAGCNAPAGTYAMQLPPGPPQNPLEKKGYTPPGATAGYPCYDHPTLVSLLEPAGITWRYYAGASTGPTQSFAIWRAPEMFRNLCQPSHLPGDACTFAGYASNVYTGNPAMVLQDLGAVQGQPCDLQQVSWVIPDGNWSDHPATGSIDAGPSWVAAIVNAVGGYTNSGAPLPNKCTDMIGGQAVPYWQDTVVLVVWDDWGGFYDDVLPWNCTATGVCNGYPNGTAQQYVYGFRVPLLVVSPYVKLTNGKPGYISGTTGQGGEVPPYVHDFGSILNFIEYVFGQGGHPLGGKGGISPAYPYADTLAPDGPLNCSKCKFSLSDFFVDFAKNPAPRRFKLIRGAQYDTGSFLDPKAHFANYPADPDDDAVDAP